MELNILKAKDTDDIWAIEDKLAENKFKVLSREHNYILMKRKRYGNTVIQLGLLFFALFFFGPIILINVVYFAYSYLARSPVVLVTTENTSDDGKPLEFNNIEEVLEKANAIL